MEIAKLAIAVFAGALGGFAAARVFGGKKDKDEHVVLKIWGGSTDVAFVEVPLKRQGDRWVGGTHCCEDAFTLHPITGEQYVSLVALLRSKHEAELAAHKAERAAEDAAEAEAAAAEEAAAVEEEVPA